MNVRFKFYNPVLPWVSLIYGIVEVHKVVSSHTFYPNVNFAELLRCECEVLILKSVSPT